MFMIAHKARKDPKAFSNPIFPGSRSGLRKRVQALGSGVYGLGFRACRGTRQGLGFRVWGLGFGVWGFGFWVLGLGSLVSLNQACLESAVCQVTGEQSFKLPGEVRTTGTSGLLFTIVCYSFFLRLLR